MRSSIAFCLVLSIFAVVYSLPYTEEELIADDLLGNDDEGLEKRDPAELERRGMRYDKLSKFLRYNNRARTKIHKNICMQWQMPCVSNSKKPGARCCSRLTCKCNIWGANCRCDDTIG